MDGGGPEIKLTEPSSDHENEAPRREMSMKRWPYFPIALGTLFISVVTSIVILFLGERIITVPTHVYLSEHKKLYESWLALPIIEISVEDATKGCRSGFEPLIYREWPGTKELCITQTKNDDILTLEAYHE